MKTAAAYIRVSTEAQTEYSPDSQLKLIKDYARKNDLILLEVYADEGISGRKADKRPAFKRMIADARRNKFDTILIYNTSRFARNHEESIVYRNMLQREGIDVISITQPSVDYKTDILMNALYAVMDERYSIELSENVKRGMKEKASRGIYISCAPLGYKRQESNKPLVIDADESPIVRWIFEQYENGNSMFNMAKELNAKGYKTKRGNLFDRRGIYRILSNPLYKGFLSWTCDNETIYMRADHEPIINEMRFDKIQDMLKENVQKKAYKIRDVSVCAHWLVGMIRCPVCGTTYVYTKGYNGRANRFRCGNYSNASCKNRHSIRVSDVEKLVMESLRNMTISDLNFTKLNTPNKPLSGNMDDSIAQFERALERAKQAYLQGVDTIDEYKKNKNNITKEIEKIKSLFSVQEKNNIGQNEIQNKINSLLNVLNAGTDNRTKNTAIRGIISKIVIDPATNNLAFYFFS